jgi:hypothetical protein
MLAATREPGLEGVRGRRPGRGQLSHRLGGSGVDLIQEEAHTWTFRDGTIVRFEWVGT